MKEQKNTLFVSLVLGLILSGLSGTAVASDVCSRGVSEPPFLSYGADSNLLLMIDNSGSMLDLAYVDETQQCYDEGYDNTFSYAGYFDAAVWYAYNFATDGPFESQAAIPALCATAHYYGQDATGSKFVCLNLDDPAAPDSVTAFVATGNFLNWATASKFDIQKDILTGGKYDSVNQNMQMESRGCMDRRFVKQVDLAQTTATGVYKLVLGVRGPMEVYETWMSGHEYFTGDIVTYSNLLYQATADHTSSDEFLTDTGNWDEYTDTRWYPGVTYNPNTAVYSMYDDAWYWTQSGGTSLGTATNITEDTNIEWVPYDGTSIEIFNIVEEGFNASACQEVIDLIGQLTGDSGDGDSNDASSRLGQIKLLTQECMGFEPGGGNTVEQARKSSFNHAMQECWYYNKFGHWQPGAGTVTSMKAACDNVYDFMDPWDITPWDSSYVCNGTYRNEEDKSPYGYVGRCWEVSALPGECTVTTCPAGRIEDEIWSDGDETYTCDDGDQYQCLKNTCNQNADDKPQDWQLMQDCPPGGGNLNETWTDDDFYYFDPCTYKTCIENDDLIDHCTSTRSIFDPSVYYFPCTEDGTAWTCYDPTDGNWAADNCYTEDPVGDLCVEQAIKDFCNILSVPEVIDPSDSTVSTDEVWNVPAYLVDSGVVGQMNLPLATMKGYVSQPEKPEGVLHRTASELRIGAMAFNDVGAKTECENEDPTDAIEKYCPADNRDGAKVITPIRLGSFVTDDMGTVDPADDMLHVDDLAEDINEIRATSWTPLAEAVYNAIGYYTQNTAMRLYEGDFQTDSDVMAGWQNDYFYSPGSYLMENDGVNDILYYTEEGGTSNDPDLNLDGVTTINTDEGVIWTIVDSFEGQWTDNTLYDPGAIVSYGGKLYITILGGTSSLNDDALLTTPAKNGPLYDTGVVWEFLIDPVINYCQGNYLLMITEGASTADINADVASFVQGTHPFNSIPIPDETPVDAVVADQCADGLVGSTYVDDLTYFAFDDDDEFNVYPTLNATLPESDYPFAEKPKNTITTYIVTAGVPRDDGTTDECNPAYLMESAAANGGTDGALSGENPQALEESLLAVFNELRQRASAGSAASVISSARGGEGAIYQAIFWPELYREDAAGNEFTVEWAGDVHGLFLDENGYVYEDTNGDRTLNPAEDLDGDGQLDCGEDLNCNGVLDVDAGEVDIDGDGELDTSEDLNGNGIFDILADIDGDGAYDTGIDTNGDGILDASEQDIDGDGHFDRYFEDSNEDGSLDGDDLRVIVYFDNTPGVERARACLNTSIIDTLGETCTNAKDLEQIRFLWSANQWLSEYPDYPDLSGGPDDLVINTNRSSSPGSFNADSRARYIFTWKDDGDGIVQDTEVVDFVPNPDVSTPFWNAADFDVQDEIAVNKIIRWMRGKDLDEDVNDNNILDAGEDTNGDNILDVLRSRQTVVADPDAPANTYAMTWRLGDVIHSTPMTVAGPAEGYHLLYNDFSYAQFLARWKNRRHIVYFGGNDGMLHAVNAGFYRDTENKFYLGYDYSNSTFNDSGPALGTEMWAYVPYNLHPHLKCLTSPNYAHKYFVDQRPRIFDVQIFPEEAECTSTDSDGNLVSTFNAPGCIHPNGWGTILVGGMRFGGTPIGAAELTNADPGDNRQFISSYFILDITNPEQPPDLLGELTQTLALDGFGVPIPGATQSVDLGYTSVIPTMVIMKDDDGTNEWYLILGSGPHGPDGVKGMSDQGAKISVLPLDWLVNQEPLRIPDAVPTIGTPAGTFAAVDNNGAPELQAFVSDLITVDFDINPSYEEYKADAVYFGTVEGETDSDGNHGFSYYDDGTTYWNGGGQMYRLVMEPGGHIVGKTGGGGEPVTEPYQWEMTTLLNLGSYTDGAGNILPQITNHPIQPITSAASVGTDGYNFWIYFGTGRFFDSDDKTDREQQSYYGIKEPMEIVVDTDGSNTYNRRMLNWEEVELFGSATGLLGSKGLAKVDEILVGQSVAIEDAPLVCRDNSDIVNITPDTGAPYGCLGLNSSPSFFEGSTVYPHDPDNNPNNAYFDKLERYIAGSGRCYRNNCSQIKTCSDDPLDPGVGYLDNSYKNNCTDGWYKEFWPYDNREKNVGQATLLGGLVTFTTYQPNSGICQAEGTAYLYGVYYKTGTSWYENIFGEYGLTNTGHVKGKLSLGRGMATTPNLHVGSGGKDGDGPKAFIQTSTGAIMEIQQDNLPIDNYDAGRTKWKEFSCP